MATRAERLRAIRENVERIVEAQTAEWVAAGCPPTMSVDGESYEWGTWLAGKLEAIKSLDALIARAEPFTLRSRHRG